MTDSSTSVTARVPTETSTVALPGAGRTWTLVAWIAFAVGSCLVVGALATDDFRDRPVVGDQASYLFQGLSLAGDGHNLSYDTADLEAWEDVGWAPTPNGLFTQRRESGWAFAKTYGYSVWLAPFLMAFPPPLAVALANSALFVAFCAFVVVALRTRYRGAVVPLAAGAFCLASFACYYGFTLHADLFVATLSAALAALFSVVASRERVRLDPLVLLFVVLCAFMLTEKAPMIVALAPILAWLLVRVPRWSDRLIVVGTLVIAFLVFSAPYLVYSDGASLTPYGGDRFYTATTPPFVAGATPLTFSGGEKFSVDFVVRSFVSEPLHGARSLGYYFFGRHTGMMVFIPAAGAFIALSAWGVWRGRARGALVGPGAAVLAGLLAYIVMYSFVFSTNYYGGGQSIGNRYFLQVSALSVAAVSLAAVPRRALAMASACTLVLGLVVLSAHHAEPRTAFTSLDRTSSLQRLFPFETGIIGDEFFECNRAVCPEESAQDAASTPPSGGAGPVASAHP